VITMPYTIRKQKCKQSDGDSGNYVLKYTDKSGKKHSACHTSHEKAKGQIAAIEMRREADIVDLQDETEKIEETALTSLIESILQETVSADDARKIEDSAKIYLNDVIHAKKKGDHIRIHTREPLRLPEAEMIEIARKIIRSAFSLVLTTAKNAGKIHSRTYDSYEVSGKDASGIDHTHYIIFAGSAASGQRGGGYAYEESLVRSLQAYGVSAKQFGDPAVTDISIMTPVAGEIGIEAKAPGAKFGQPTLVYNYKTRAFQASDKSRSQESANMIAAFLNVDQDAPVHAWMHEIQTAWNQVDKHDASNLKYLAPMDDVYGTQVSADAYDNFLKGKVSQSAPPVEVPVSTVIEYYAKKGADYVQIQGKGLYSINDVLKIGTLSFLDAVGAIQPTVKVELLTSNQRKVLRGTVGLNFKKMASSNFSLDNPDDLMTFADKCTNVSERIYVLKSLISEEITASDKREIERISRRQARIEIERAVGPDLGKAIREEVSKILGSRATRDEITDMIEAVISRLHVEIGR
jgi:hypothetical protein